MIISAEFLPKVILVSTLLAELFLVAIPLLLLLAYRQKNSLPIRSLWFGMGLAILTCIKFLFLIKQQLFSDWEPYYSVFIIIIFEVIVREWIVRRWDKWGSRFVAIQFVVGYLFAKLLGIGTSVFLFFTWMLARLNYIGKGGAMSTEAFQQTTPYIQLILHSLFNLGYMFLLFSFILIRIRLVDQPRRIIVLTEWIFFLFQGGSLLAINTPTIPVIPVFFAVIVVIVNIY